MKKKENKQPDATKKQRNYGSVVGVLQMFVVVSIAYSTFLIATGTEGYIPKLMLIPQAMYATLLVVKKFTK